MNREIESPRTTTYSRTGTKDPNDLSKLLIGGLTGAVVGTLVGSLYTQKGFEMRSRVSYKSRKLGNNIKEKASDITDSIKDKVSTISGGISEKVTGITSAVSEKYQATKEVAVDVFKKQKPKASVQGFSSAYYDPSVDDVEISRTKVILAGLAVSTLGTIIWSLTTEKGKETRKSVISSSKKLANTVKEKIPEIKETLQQAYNDAKKGADELAERQQQGDYTSPGINGYNNSTLV